MTDAPTFPARQLWAEAQGGPLSALACGPAPFRAGEPIAFVGGKLAAALIGPLQAAGFPPVVSDRRHPVLAHIPPEEPEYEAFGHGHGEVHSAREFRQLVERAARTFTPAEDRWPVDGRVVDPFRPGLRYAAVTDQEFDVLQERHLNAVRTAFRRARSLVVSLSQSEIWESKADGAVFPGWTAAAERYFDPEAHAVRSLTVEETVLDLLGAVKALRTINPELAIVLMVSPEPQLATTHPAHVHVAGTVGKAILRIAMEAVAGSESAVYFPALEIAALTSPASAYGPDGSIPGPVVAAIAKALIVSAGEETAPLTTETRPITVFRTMPAGPRPVKKPRPPAPAIGDAPAPPPAPSPAKQKAKPKPKPSAIAVVDPYSEAKAAEAKAKAERRAAHLATMGQVPPADAEAEKPTMSQTERQVMRREKALAREARLAAAAAAQRSAPEPESKIRRKIKKAQAGAEPSAQAAQPKPRREKKRDAKA